LGINNELREDGGEGEVDSPHIDVTWTGKPQEMLHEGGCLRGQEFQTLNWAARSLTLTICRPVGVAHAYLLSNA
jgi:hypothetical protein